MPTRSQRSQIATSASSCLACRPPGHPCTRSYTFQSSLSIVEQWGCRLVTLPARDKLLKSWEGGTQCPSSQCEECSER